MIAAGFRKHPRLFRAISYNDIEAETSSFTLVFEATNPETRKAYPQSRLAEERDLHMDMSREGGIRSDAHMIRYYATANFIRPGDRVLDAACGLGYGSHILFQNSLASKVSGVDNSQYAVDYANTSFGLKGGQVVFEHASLPDYIKELEEGSVDFIASFETLEHLEEPGEFLDACFRALAPGGRLAISVPNDWTEEDGKDPNPHHFQVYTWERVLEELSGRFLIEKSFAQSASRKKVKGEWAPAVRDWQEVPSSNAGSVDCEWCVVVCMRPPLAQSEAKYTEGLFPEAALKAKPVLIDFSTEYDNPWLLRSMVSIGVRMNDPEQLARLAEEVRQVSTNSNEVAAATCVLAYRELDAWTGYHRTNELLSQITSAIERADLGSATGVRWVTSLHFASGLLHLTLGDLTAAEVSFQNASRMPFEEYSALLATKTVEAAFRAGMLLFARGERASARQAWRRGVDMARKAVARDWDAEFGSLDFPPDFALRELTAVLDIATRCGAALSVLTDAEDRPEAIGRAFINNASQAAGLRRHQAELLHRLRESSERLDSQSHQNERLKQEISALSLTIDAMRERELDGIIRYKALESRYSDVESYSNKFARKMRALEINHARDILKQKNETTVLKALLEFERNVYIDNVNEARNIADEIRNNAATSMEAMVAEMNDKLRIYGDNISELRSALGEAREYIANHITRTPSYRWLAGHARRKLMLRGIPAFPVPAGLQQSLAAIASAADVARTVEIKDALGGYQWDHQSRLFDRLLHASSTNHAALVEASGLFDPEWYRRENPDIGDMDPLNHYLNHGGFEGRKASPSFDTRRYVAEHPDVADTGLNPLVHYLAIGFDQGRFAAIEPRLVGVAEEVLQDNLAFEPELSATSELGDIVNVPWVRSLKRDKFFLAWDAIYRSLGAVYAHIVFVPWLTHGGADLVACNIVKAAIERHGVDNVLFVVTDHANLSARAWLPEQAHVCVFSDFDASLDHEARVRLVESLILALRPKAVMNVNSRACWDAIERRGKALSRITDLYATFFCKDYTLSGRPAGYSTTHFRSCFPHMKKIYVDNQRFMQELISEYGVIGALRDRLVVLKQPTSSDASLQAPLSSVRSTALPVLWAGRFSRQKNVELLISIAEKAPHRVFHVYGRGDEAYEAMLKDATSRLPNLVIKGPYSSFGDLPVEQYACLLFTSLWEGTPTTLINAAVAQLPIIASDVGGVGELVTDATGWIIRDVANADDYVDALNGPYCDPDEALRRSWRMLELVQSEHSWNKFSAGLSVGPGFLA